MLKCVICSSNKNLIYNGEYRLHVKTEDSFSIERIEPQKVLCEDCLLVGANMDNPVEENIKQIMITEHPFNLNIYNKQELLTIVKNASKLLTEITSCSDKRC